MICLMHASDGVGPGKTRQGVIHEEFSRCVESDRSEIRPVHLSTPVSEH